ILPDRTIDPWDAINPHDLWLMVVLIAAISFAGYVAVRVFGERRGRLVSAAAGALVSSTTVTLVNAQAAAASRQTGAPTMAILVAWIVSFARVTVIACVINAELITFLVPAIGAAMLVLAAAAILFGSALHDEHTTPVEPGGGSTFDNPLDLNFVLGFGALLA